jgi:hypothetical protein
VCLFVRFRYKSDGEEEHNASASESDKEDTGDFLVAEGERNANITHDMGHWAKKRLRRWRSLVTPEERAAKV